MIKKVILSLIMLVLPATLILAADNTGSEGKSGKAVGFAVDFLPYVMSASTGHAGFSLQGYYGYDHLRFRLVGARIFMNDRFIGSSPFTGKKMTVGAAIVDYCFGDHFDKFWVGAGAEYWHCGITHDRSNEHVTWNDAVLTIGGGYIFTIAGNAYIEPWAAAHCVAGGLDHRTKSGRTYTSQRFSAEMSLKAGYFFDL